MTLVAAVTPDECAIVLGDILLSGKPLPGADYIDLPGGPTEAPIVHLARKVCVLSDTVVVAWSGNFSDAQLVLRKMARLFSSGHHTADDINKFLASTEHTARGLQILGFCAEPPHRIGFISSPNVKAENLLSFRRARLSGNGAPLLRSFVQAQEGLAETATGQINPLSHAVGMVLRFCSWCMGMQMQGVWKDRVPLLSAERSEFGGVFEIVAWMDGKFNFIEDVVYLFWSLNEYSSEEYNITLHMPIVYVSHLDEFLLVRWLAGSGGLECGGKQKIVFDKSFAVGPIHRDTSEKEIEDLRRRQWSGFDSSKVQCHVILTKEKKQERERHFDGSAMVLVALGGENKMKIGIEVVSDTVGISTSESLGRMIWEAVEQRLKEEAKHAE